MQMYRHHVTVSTYEPRARVDIRVGESLMVDGRMMVQTVGGHIEPSDGWHSARHHAHRWAASELESISRDLWLQAQEQLRLVNALVLEGQQQIHVPLSEGVARTGD